MLRRLVLGLWVIALLAGIVSLLFSSSAQAAPLPNVAFTVNGNVLTLNNGSNATLSQYIGTTFNQIGNTNFYKGTVMGKAPGIGGAGQSTNCPTGVVEVDATNKTAYYYVVGFSSISAGQAIPSGFGLDSRCREANVKYDSFHVAAPLTVTKAPTTSGTGSGTGSGSKTPEDTPVQKCQKKGAFFGYVICQLIDVLNNVLDFFYSFAVDHLAFSLFAPVNCNDAGKSGLANEAKQGCDGAKGTNSYDNVKSAWGVFARLATGLLVAVFMVMIIGQAAANIMDAYTVKKLLPRLVIAFIIINVSWYLCGVAMQITNILADGIRGIILAPFANGQNQVVTIVTPNAAGSATLLTAILAGGFAAFIASGGTIVTAALFALPGILLTAVIGLFIGFIVVILRQAALLVMTVASPIAAALWVLPGTTRYSDKYRDTYLGVLLAYPIFQGILAAGALIATVTQATNPDSGDGVHPVAILKFIVAVVCLFLPYFMLPKVFQWSSSALSSIYNFGQGKAGGLINATNQAADKRKQQTRPYVAKQVADMAKQQNRTAAGVASLEGRRGRWAANWNAETLARAQSIGRDYVSEDQQKRLRFFNPHALQALAETNGDVDQALASLQGQGINNVTRDQLQGVRDNVAGMGMRFNDANTLQAIGNIGSSHGELLGSYANFVEGGANGALQAEGAGIAGSWRLQARQQGQYSLDVSRVNSLTQPSNGDRPRVLEQISQQVTAPGAVQVGATTLPSGQVGVDLQTQEAQHAMDLFVQASLGPEAGQEKLNVNQKRDVDAALENIVNDLNTQQAGTGDAFRAELANRVQQGSESLRRNAA